ncbi:hypothetical protein BCA37_10565 [Mycobacterium sp. djl-10]|nr:hypothetical protein BCA37_10565 [Mycobacterium sp. djl-10]
MSTVAKSAAIGGAVGAVTGVLGMVASVFAAAAVNSTRARRKAKTADASTDDASGSKFTVVPGGAS